VLIQDAYNSGKPGKLREFCNSGKLREFCNSGKLREISGNFCKCNHGHRVLCIIVSNHSIDWLGGTVTGVGGASHPCFVNKIFSVLPQESCRNDCYVNSLRRFSLHNCLEITVQRVWKTGKLREFHFAKFVSTVSDASYFH